MRANKADGYSNLVLNGFFGDIQNGRNFFVAEILASAHHKDLTAFVWQFFDQGMYLLFGFAGLQQIDCRYMMRGHFKTIFEIGGIDFFLFKPIKTFVTDYGVEQGFQRLSLDEFIALFPHSHEGIVNDFVGIFARADVLHTKPMQRRMVLFIERFNNF